MLLWYCFSRMSETSNMTNLFFRRAGIFYVMTCSTKNCSWNDCLKRVTFQEIHARFTRKGNCALVSIALLGGFSPQISHNCFHTRRSFDHLRMQPRTATTQWLIWNCSCSLRASVGWFDNFNAIKSLWTTSNNFIKYTYWEKF